MTDRRDVLRWFISRAYARSERVIAGTYYTVLRFVLVSRDELSWTQGMWQAIGAHMFAREYDPDRCTWDCELRVPGKLRNCRRRKKGV